MSTSKFKQLFVIVEDALASNVPDVKLLQDRTIDFITGGHLPGRAHRFEACDKQRSDTGAVTKLVRTP